MTEEEDDYMSDRFLSGISDVRPSLIQNRAKKRLVEVANKQIIDKKRQRQEQIERAGVNTNERLQESLKKPIEPENKGYQLLAKMGYKPGQALGKDASANNTKALTVPIGISIKEDRGGLGREAALRELAEKRLRMREAHLKKQIGESLTEDEFRKRATQKAEERFLFGALKRCQRSCENLDTEHHIKEPVIEWFWPERICEDKESEGTSSEANCNEEKESTDELDEYTSAEKLELLTSYLRTSYLFCFWCGVRYKDQSDLNESCPGVSRDDH